ncbi:MAG TPA: glycosyltransferase [Thermoanaerobacter sp.]|nr:glycosyltransferase [Thermoanaerobacter sp.]
MRGKFKKDYWIIKFSRFFDTEYYFRKYPDVRKAEVDPIEHYVLYGWEERRNPNSWFNTLFYLEKYPDVSREKINPFVHWIRYGRKEGRITNPESYVIPSGKICNFSNVNRWTQKTYQILKKEGVTALLKKIIKKIKLLIINGKSMIIRKYFSIKYKRIEKWYNDTDILIEQQSTLNGKFTACTIVSKNYLSHAITLGQSFKLHNSNWDFKVLLCDLLESKEDIKLYLRLKEKGIPLIPIYALRDKIDIPNLEEMLFKYNVLEMNTAIKPFFLEYLLSIGYEKVVYFDPDILILNRIDEIEKLLEEYNIILTPHILENIPDDGKKPTNLDILISGIYNLGFLAIKNTKETIKFLKWWQEKLLDGCFMNIEKGFHVDQKWIDFVPALFQRVHILKKKSYNVAYWNLHERKIIFKDGKWYVNEEPLIFFHFSGFIIEDIDRISKHQSRFSLNDFPVLKKLFNFYRTELLKNDFVNINNKPYFFGKLPGTSIRIDEFMRKMYKEVLPKITNPWNPDNVSRIINVMNEKIYPPITRLWFSIYNMRPDLQRVFSNIENSSENRHRFLNWIHTSAKREYNLPNLFIEPEHDSYSNYLIKEQLGINLWGYFKKMMGVGESARYLFNSIKEVGIPFTLVNIESEYHKDISAKELREIEGYFSKENIYKVNLIVVNADQIPHVYEHYGYDRFKNKYNIGFWAWEIEDYFPFKNSFDYVDEIWYFSDFVCQTYKKYTSKPVIKIPFPFRPNWKYIIDPKRIRDKFGISQEDFVFIFSFDFHSSFERKNPDGIVRAFIKAFEGRNKNVKLIIKSLHAEYHPSEYEILKKLTSGHKNILYIDRDLSREEYISLVNASDCFVSLHRSEGLGMGIIEAMYLGKCVIATAYGGSMEFTTPYNSLLVDYKLSPIKQDFGPYKKGQLWADPNEDQCVEYMRFVCDNREKAIEIGKKASEDVKNLSSMAPYMIAKRVLEIY